MENKIQKRTIKEIEDEMEKLRECCEWNGLNMKETPAYKRLEKELNYAKRGKSE